MEKSHLQGVEVEKIGHFVLLVSVNPLYIGDERTRGKVKVGCGDYANRLERERIEGKRRESRMLGIKVYLKRPRERLLCPVPHPDRFP